MTQVMAWDVTSGELRLKGLARGAYVRTHIRMNCSTAPLADFIRLEWLAQQIAG